MLVLSNAAAGGTDAEAVDLAVSTLRAAAEVEHVATTGSADLDAALDRRDGRSVVVIGGDGSLHAVVNALWERSELREAVVGLVPLGTGNDLARGAGLPLDPAEAAGVVLSGTPRGLDLLMDASGSVVLNAVNIGIGAAAARQAAPLKSRLGRVAYAAGAVLAGVRERGWHLRVEVDGRTITDGSRRVLHIVLANGPTVGGGTSAAPDADPSDGFVDVVVSYAVGPVARLGYAARLRTGEHLVRADVRRALGRRILVTGEPFPWNADGEIGAPRRDGRWTVESEAWRLILAAE